MKLLPVADRDHLRVRAEPLEQRGDTRAVVLVERRVNLLKETDEESRHE